MGKIFGYFLIGFVLLFMILDLIYIIKKRNSCIHTNSILIYTLVPLIIVGLSFIPDPFCYLAIGIFILIFMVSFLLAERISLFERVKIDVFNIKKSDIDGVVLLLNKRQLDYEIFPKKGRVLKIRIEKIEKKEVKNLLKEINEFVDSVQDKKERNILIGISMAGYIVYIIFIYSLVCTGLMDAIFK